MAAVVFSGRGRRGPTLVQAPTAFSGPAFLSPGWLSLVQIVQIVTGSTTTMQQTGSTTRADTGLTATITPTSTLSRILICATQAFQSYDVSAGGSSSVGGDLVLLRDTTNIINMTLNGGNGWNSTVSYCGIDSPSTLASVTYKTQYAVSASPGVNDRTRVQYSSAQSSIVLMELA